MPSSALAEGAAACVQEVSSGKGSVRVRLHDKVAALEKLARHLGLFPTSRAVVSHAGRASAATDGEGSVVIYLPDNGRRFSPPALPPLQKTPAVQDPRTNGHRDSA